MTIGAFFSLILVPLPSEIAGVLSRVLVLRCHHCQHSWELSPPVARSSECPGCRRDARVCLNCKFYDPGASRACREEQAEWVKEKDRSNFCSYFSPGASVGKAATDTARSKLDALFAKGAEPAAPSTPTGGGFAADLAKFLKDKR